MQELFERVLPGNRHGGPSVLWVVANTVVYYIISGILLFATMWIPASDTSNSIIIINFRF